MGRYILRRLLLMIPTLWAIITVNFFIVQVAPGGPVDQAIANAQGRGTSMAMQRLTGQGGQEVTPQGGASATGKEENTSLYRGARGLDPEVVKEIRKRFGFDKPLLRALRGDAVALPAAGFRRQPLPGAERGGADRVEPARVHLPRRLEHPDHLPRLHPAGDPQGGAATGAASTCGRATVILVGSAIPQLLFAVLLIILFAGGSYLQWFPLRGLVSNNFSSLSFFGKIGDYFVAHGAARHSPR